MLDKIRDWLDLHFDKYMPKNSEASFGYYGIMIIYNIIQIALFCVFGLLFSTWKFAIIGSIVFITMQSFTYNFHCNILEHCILTTQLLFIIFGILTKITPTWFVYLLCLYCCRDIYLKSPLELNEDFKDKKKEWYVKKILFFMSMYLILSLVCYYLCYYELCKCILFGLIMLDLVLFKNDKEYV